MAKRKTTKSLPKRMTVGQLRELLLNFDDRAEIGVSIEEGADLEDILSVEENENGVWICALPERDSEARKLYDKGEWF